MSLDTLHTVANQVENTARNAANNAVASARRDTSITGWANRVVSGFMKKCADPPKVKAEGVYILPTKALRASWRMVEHTIVAPDGYVRRSPVQEIAEDPDLGRRRLIRVLQGLAAIAVLALVVYVLVRMNIIGI